MMVERQTRTVPTATLSLASLFDDLEAAQDAAEHLKAAGIAQSNISLITAGETAGQAEDRFLGRLKSLLFPLADHAEYSEAIRRGGHVLAVSGLSVEQFDQAVEIFKDAGAVDLDARTESWRAEGWDDRQRVLKEPKDTTAIVDEEVATSLIESGRGDEIVTVVTESLPVGQRSDKSEPRVRVYTVEHAWTGSKETFGTQVGREGDERHHES